MTQHEFQMPAAVEEIRPEQRQSAVTPEAAPAVPVATDDGRPLAASAPSAPAPAAR
ncbi:MAG TPA: hypothetical protein VLA98_07600 [Solirubrobacteraceae bacterium]|nr:hypothetical protein [Solirubrobacteraceae bacterium]